MSLTSDYFALVKKTLFITCMSTR